MAQKSAKQLAVRNTSRLKQTHLITLGVHLVFVLLAFTLRRSLKFTPYLALSAPALGLEYWLDSIARPRYDDAGKLWRAGEDLDARGLTEFFWDIIYWTWINLVLVAIFGNRGWWLYFVVPIYAIYAAVTTAKGVKGMFGGMQGAAGEGDTTPQAQSKRQQKLEQRGGQKAKYR